MTDKQLKSLLNVLGAFAHLPRDQMAESVMPWAAWIFSERTTDWKYREWRWGKKS